MIKILWLDDEPDNIAVEQDIIEDEFDDAELAVTIDVVKTLEACLQRLAESAYQAVILDLQINLGANADAVQQTWAGAGVYAWIRRAGDLSDVSGLPDLVRDTLNAEALKPCEQTINAPIAIVSGVAKNDVVGFIRDLTMVSTNRPILQVFDKPIDERKFTDFIAQVVKLCRS